jgi:hypothetical protein
MMPLIVLLMPLILIPLIPPARPRVFSSFPSIAQRMIHGGI